VNFQKYVDWQHSGQWPEAARDMAEALERLHGAGADFGLIATNTMHIIIERLRAQGAQGIVLGCTEIPLLVEPQHCALPLFNTSLLHAAKALDFALQV
jgi:aspartate/glutamate racemase